MSFAEELAMKACRVALRFSQACRNLENATPEFIKRRLPPEQLQAIMQLCGVTFRRRLFTPMSTLWLWLWQRLRGASCRHVVGSAFAWAVGKGQQPASTDCSGYCQARMRQKETFLKRTAQQLAEQTDADSDFQAFGRPVFLVDGTSAKVADTSANRQAFPLGGGQNPGASFPKLRMLAIFSLATGVLRHLATGAFHGTSEQGLFYSLWPQLPAGSIVVADRYFDTFRNLALLLNRGVHCVFKLNAHRNQPDLRRCHKRLGKGDALFEWRRPQRKDWLLASDYDEAPETLVVRIIRYTLKLHGFRSKPVVLVTTLLDPVAYPAAQVAALYGRRWEVEINLRHIKSTLGMDLIDARSPAMVRKEIWVFMLAYNLIRQIMYETAVSCGLDLARVSFAGTAQLVLDMTPVLSLLHGGEFADAYDMLLQGIAQRPVRHRPNRSEPRVVKRRNTKYTHMTRPRNQYDRKLNGTIAKLSIA
jgi:hypothetical protein